VLERHGSRDQIQVPEERERGGERESNQSQKTETNLIEINRVWNITKRPNNCAIRISEKREEKIKCQKKHSKK
jgi:hypothetical protein